MKRLFLCLLGIFLLSGCSSPSIEPTFDAATKLQAENISFGTNFQLKQNYEAYIETDAFKYFVDCVNYGETLNYKRQMDEPDVDIDTLVNLVETNADNFLNSNVGLTPGIRELNFLQKETVQAFKTFASLTEKYLNNYSESGEEEATDAYFKADDDYMKCIYYAKDDMNEQYDLAEGTE